MGNYVQVQLEHETDVDYFNRDHIVRIQATIVGSDAWIVRVLVTTGLEVVDSRHDSEQDARARVAELMA